MQVEVDTSKSSFRERLAADFAERRERIRRLSRRRAVPVLEISTESEVATQVRDQIGRARVSRRGS